MDKQCGLALQLLQLSSMGDDMNRDSNNYLSLFIILLLGSLLFAQENTGPENSQLKEIDELKETNEFTYTKIPAFVISSSEAEKLRKSKPIHPKIILNSIVTRKNEMPSTNLGKKEVLGNFEYIIFQDDDATAEFLQINYGAIENLKVARFGPMMVVTDGTLIINYKNESDLRKLSNQYNIMLKTNLPGMKIAFFEPINFNVIEDLLETLPLDSRVQSVRLDYINTDILPE